MKNLIHFHLIGIFIALSASAAPRNPNAYEPPTVGLFQLQTGTVIEGSRDFGGITPDFLVDWDATEFDMIRDFARSLKKKALPANEIADQLQAHLLQAAMVQNSSDPAYLKILKNTDSEGRVPLSAFIRARAGSCREKSYVMHLAMAEAGVINRVAYVRMNAVVENANDHSFVIYLDDQTLRIADATGNVLHGKSVHEVTANGRILSLNLFPRVWKPLRLVSSKVRTTKKIPYAKYQKLLQIMAARVPDLKPIWKLSQSGGYDIRIGGGVLRGLLLWVSEQAEVYTPEQIQQLTPPETRLLILNRTSDRDIYASASTKAKLKDLPEFRGWDFVDDDLFDESIRAGGTTFDKIRLSPEMTQDPLGGLRAFHEGRLEYKVVPAKILHATYWFREKNNSETAMVLRYLRLHEDFPELQVDPEMFEYIRRVAKTETPTLGKEHQYWVWKGLTKLFEATYRDAAKTAATLQSYGLLQTLSAQGYRLPLDTAMPIPFSQLMNLGFSPQQVAASERLFDYTFGSAKTIRDGFQHALTPEAAEVILVRGLALLETAQEFATAFQGSKKEATFLHDLRGQLLLQHLPLFLDMKPSGNTVSNLLMDARLADVIDEQVYLQSATRMGSARDYVDLFRPITQTPSDAHSRSRGIACAATVNSFANLNPRATEVRELLLLGAFPDEIGTDEIVLEATAPKMRTAEEYIELLLPIRVFPSPVFNEARNRVVAKTLSIFFALKPKEAQVIRFLDEGRFQNANVGAILSNARSILSEPTYRLLRSQYPNAPDVACASLLHEKR